MTSNRVLNPVRVFPPNCKIRMLKFDVEKLELEKLKVRN
jgi:hypothetical protein